MLPFARSRLVRPLARFARTGADEQRLIVEAVWRLMVARVLLAMIPFPRLARRMGGFLPPEAARACIPTTVKPNDSAVATRIGRAVTRAARHTPFAAVCLPQAMAARAMLRARGIGSIMHLGTMPGNSRPLMGHVWLDAAGVEVTGYPLDLRVTEVACLA
jgi:hypothetical protein